jgi:hypothetical protein
MVDLDAMDADPWPTWPVDKNELRGLVDDIERLREVVLLGVNARKCQVIYFKTRNRDALLVSKNAERAFDDAARAALEGEASDGAAAQSVRETIILTEKEKRSFEMSRELAQIYNRVMLERKLSDDAAT